MMVRSRRFSGSGEDMFFFLKVFGLFISIEKSASMLESGFGDPFIIGRGESLPSYQILNFVPNSLVGADAFYFKFFFVIDNIWGRFREIRAVNVIFPK